jgi:protein gp37
MAENSKIEWTTHTFNPWRGCTKVSAGCSNCYAETMSGRNPKTLGVWGPNGTRVVAAEAAWKEPLKWDRKAAEAGERHRVFCASLADVMEDWRGTVSNSQGLLGHVFDDESVGFGPDLVGDPPSKSTNVRPLVLSDVRRRLFALIDATPNLDWLILTKRPENVLRMTYDAWCKKVPGHVSQDEGDGRQWAWPKNLWIGTSIENQSAANERIPHLLKVPAAVRFLSVEPMLGPVDLSSFLGDSHVAEKCGSASIRSGEGRGTGDRQRGPDLACGGETMEPMGASHASDSLRAAASRACDRKLSASSSDDRQEQGSRLGSSNGLDALQRPVDTRGTDHQPQGRQPSKQPPGQSRTSDLLGASHSHEGCIGQGDAGRRKEQQRETQRRSGQGDPIATSYGGAVEVDRVGLRSERPDHIEDSSRQSLGIGWIICGGESGHGARPCNVAWIRSIVAQCKAAGTACFVKQLGKHYFSGDGNHSHIFPRDSKGGDMAEFPADLRIRQFPA